jgi:hypothetical protein
VKFRRVAGARKGARTGTLGRTTTKHLDGLRKESPGMNARVDICDIYPFWKPGDPSKSILNVVWPGRYARGGNFIGREGSPWMLLAHAH